jgi:hypothetical protein
VLPSFNLPAPIAKPHADSAEQAAAGDITYGFTY